MHPTVGEAHWLKPPTLPGTMSCFVTEIPGKEHGTHKPPLTGRVRERTKGDTMCPITFHNPSRWHPSWLSNACATRKDSESGWLTKDNLETIPITITWDCEPCVRAVFLGSLTLQLSAQEPFPVIFLAWLAHVCLDSSFTSVREEPIFGPWKVSPFLQHKDSGF